LATLPPASHMEAETLSGMVKLTPPVIKNEEDEDEVRRFWDDDLTLALIRSWTEVQLQGASGAINMTSDYWLLVANKVNSVKKGITKTVRQCKVKMDTLRRQFRKSSTGPQSGQGQQTWKWYDEMATSLQYSAKFNGKGIPGGFDHGTIVNKEKDAGFKETPNEEFKCSDNGKNKDDTKEDEASNEEDDLMILDGKKNSTDSSENNEDNFRNDKEMGNKRKVSPLKEDHKACSFDIVKGKSVKVDKTIDVLDLPHAIKEWSMAYKVTEEKKIE
jgi:Myb/SANT-like DNA-binding domain